MVSTGTRIAVLLSAMIALGTTAAIAQSSGGSSSPTKAFSLGATDNEYNPGPSYPDPVAYPAPHMVQQPAHLAPAPPPKQKPMQAAVQQTVVPPRPQYHAQVQQQAPPPGVLPGQFMGNWNVLSSRAKIEARPELQDRVANAYPMSMSQTWSIGGQPGRYSMNSSSGVSSVQVGNCTASVAYIRYQHQVINTMAQEAIVMQLSPDGRSFQGMERITIVKPGEPGPRFVVTYNLMGQRQ